MRRRGLIATGLGMSLSAAGFTSMASGFAQESTAGGKPADSVDLAEWEAERTARNEAFLERFTENLGLSDPALVESAFKATLQDMVDEQFAAGEISANLAEELKTRIDETEGPLLFGPPLGARHEVMLRGGGPFHDRGGVRPRAGRRWPIQIQASEHPFGEDVEISLPSDEEADSAP